MEHDELARKTGKPPAAARALRSLSWSVFATGVIALLLPAGMEAWRFGAICFLTSLFVAMAFESGGSVHDATT